MHALWFPCPHGGGRGRPLTYATQYATARLIHDASDVPEEIVSHPDADAASRIAARLDNIDSPGNI
jgi:hypothetical protein